MAKESIWTFDKIQTSYAKNSQMKRQRGSKTDSSIVTLIDCLPNERVARCRIGLTSASSKLKIKVLDEATSAAHSGL